MRLFSFFWSGGWRDGGVTPSWSSRPLSLTPFSLSAHQTEGYTSRFGITYVDYATQERHPKASAKWLAARFRGAGKGNETEGESGGGADVA